MARKLFLLQFKRALVPFVVFALASYGALYLAELWFIHVTKNPASVHDGVNILILAIIVILAFPTGATAFSKEFKDTHFLFLQSLPIRRERAWGVLVLASLAASLISVALFFVLRPSLVGGFGDPEKAPLLLTGTFLYYFVFFTAGCCFSLLFGRMVFCYLAGYLVTAAMTAEVMLMGAYSGSEPVGEYTLSYLPTGRDFDLSCVVVGWLLVSLVYLLLSMYFYVYGEFNLTRTQIRNAASIVGSLGIVWVVLAVSVNAGAFAAYDRWETEQYGWRQATVDVSGKYFSVLERRTRHPQFARIHIFDVATGARLSTFARRGIARVAWSSEGGVLRLAIKEDSPLYRLGYILPGSDRLVYLSPQAHQLLSKKFAFSQLHGVESVARGKTLLVVKSGDTGRIVSMDESTGELTELGEGYLDGYAEIFPLPNENLIWFGNEEAPSRLWLAGSDFRELKWAPSPEPEKQWSCVLYGIIYKTRAACVKEMTRRFPFGANGDGKRKVDAQGWYVAPVPSNGFFSRFNCYLDDATKVFYLQHDAAVQHGKLFVFRGPQEGWRLVGEGIPLNRSKWEIPDPGAIDFVSNRVGSLTVGQALAAYYAEKADRVHGYLYDSALDKTMDLGNYPRPSENQTFSVNIRHVEGLKGEIIFLGLFRSQKWNGVAFRYEPMSGSLVKLQMAESLAGLSPYFLVHMDEDGNSIYEEWNPFTLTLVSADQKQRQLWPPASH